MARKRNFADNEIVSFRKSERHISRSIFVSVAIDILICEFVYEGLPQWWWWWWPGHKRRRFDRDKGSLVILVNKRYFFDDTLDFIIFSVRKWLGVCVWCITHTRKKRSNREMNSHIRTYYVSSHEGTEKNFFSSNNRQ